MTHGYLLRPSSMSHISEGRTSPSPSPSPQANRPGSKPILTLSLSLFFRRPTTRIDMIGAACEAAEKVISDCHKSYGLGSRQGPTLVPTLDKVQATKIQEQENVLRAAVNFGEGAYEKNTSLFSSNQGVLQVITLRTWVMKGLHRLQILFFDLDSFCTERLCLLLHIEWAKADTFVYYTVKTAFERPLLNGVAYAERVVHSQRETFEREAASEYEFKVFKGLMPKNLPRNMQGTTSTSDIIEGTQVLSEEQ